MEIPCRCPSCGTQFKVGQQHAGHKVKCPKCSGPFAVPALAKPLDSDDTAEEGIAADALQPVPSDKPEATRQPPGEAQSKPALVAGAKPAPPKRRAPPKGESPDEPCAAAGSGTGLPAIDVHVALRVKTPAAPAGADSPAADASGEARARRQRNLLLMAGGGGFAAVLLAAVGVIALVRSNSSGPEDKPAPKAPAKAYLVLDWEAKDRGDARVYIDKKVVEVPKTGAVKLELEPGEHRVVVMRRGFEPWEVPSLVAKAGGTYHFKPAFEKSFEGLVSSGFPKPGEGAPKTGPTGMPKPSGEPVFDDWLQDFEAAKAKAAKENKDILIAFDGSDWCGWSIKLAKEVLLQPEFRARVEGQYVLVFIDFPRRQEGKAKVQDAERNKKLGEHFEVEGYPTLVLADSEGRPFGYEGYVQGGIEAFIERLSDWQDVKMRRDAAFLEVQSLEDKNKLKAIRRAVALLEQLDNLVEESGHDAGVLRFYEPLLADWLKAAEKFDPKNAEGDLEAVFTSVWVARLASAAQKEDKDRVAEIAKQLDQWGKTYQFKDQDRAAMAHLRAAEFLFLTGQAAEAGKYLEAAKKFKPSNPVVAAMLEQAARAITEGFGHGTGFVVAQGGYVLTNHHVIEGRGKTLVQLSPDPKDRVPAEVVAKDEKGDIALLRFDAPAGRDLEPVPIAAVEVRRGMKIATFGFGGGASDVGSGMKFTQGSVSSLPEAGTEGMVLLDCRVNPGNSGGPLVDNRGNVIGMVTAKSLSSEEYESFGMALPAENLRKFLTKHLPKSQKLPAGTVSQKPLEWDEIDRLVSPSVVKIVKAP